MFQTLFIPGETSYNREVERHVAEIILERHLDALETLLALYHWCLHDGTGIVGPLPEYVREGTESYAEWYRREGKAWHERTRETWLTAYRTPGSHPRRACVYGRVHS